MKSFLLCLLFAIVTLAIGCDEIAMPYKQTSGNGGGNPQPAKRKVLLEEFTGTGCQFCPDGHRKAAELLKYYGDNLITIGFHATELAMPTKKLPVDFRTADAEILYKDLGGSSLPTGIINRTKVNGSWVVGRDGWGSIIQNEVEKEVEASLKLSPEFNKATSTMKLHCTTAVLKQQNEKLYLAVYVVEDNVVAPQTDHDIIIPDYVHRNVFRAAPLGLYGRELSNTAINAGTEFTQDFSFPISNPAWNIANCKIIAIVHRNSPDYTVLQVEEAAVAK